MQDILHDLNAILVHGNDHSWARLELAHEDLDGEVPRRAAVVGVIEDGVRRQLSFLRRHRPPEVRRELDAVLRDIRAALTRVASDFHKLSPEHLGTAFARIKQLEPDIVMLGNGNRASRAKGGAGNVGIYRVAAELSFECNAFGDRAKARGGEARKTTLNRLESTFRNACNRPPTPTTRTP
jgi:hypothetical protein